MKYIDLHTHTNASDGTLSPWQLAEHAKNMGLSAMAITDHDTVSGLREGINAGLVLGVEVIPGIEISVDYESEMHILGYFINDNDIELNNTLISLVEHRNSRNKIMIDKMRSAGIDISYNEVFKLSGGNVVGRAHIASVLVNKGYARDTADAFERFVGGKAKFYEKKQKLSPSEGIALIKKAGGLAVLAHPYLLRLEENTLFELIKQLKTWQLDGIECLYPLHDYKQTAIYLEIAKRLDMLVTGGSDFHGGTKPEIEIGNAYNYERIDYSILTQLKTMLKHNSKNFV